ncbi:MAG: prolipoprotein diacylglyceryl transferase [Actinobacteria bacterium]|nr:MAG: prolipoprotein diacylglyceryl transferase [Actinomycetota bacterium]
MGDTLGSVQPQVHLGPLTIQTFGICFALGFAACGLLAARRLGELGLPRDWAYETIFAALVGGLVGARLDYVIENWNTAHRDLLGSLFSGSGLVWYGGMIGGALGVVLWAWRRNFLGLRLLDYTAPGLALGYAIGRIGCQVSGDGDYGIGSQADRHPGAAHADLRDAGDGAHRPRALAAARPGAPGHPVRPLAGALGR